MIGAVDVSPWVWEPEASDSLRIAVGTRTRRIIVRVWMVARERHGRFVEQRRPATGKPWRTILSKELTAADLAGGSTDPKRTRYARAGFLAFDASTLGVEDHGGLAYTVVATEDQPLIVRFGAHDPRSGRWNTVTRLVNH